MASQKHQQNGIDGVHVKQKQLHHDGENNSHHHVVCGLHYAHDWACTLLVQFQAGKSSSLLTLFMLIVIYAEVTTGISDVMIPLFPELELELYLL